MRKTEKCENNYGFGRTKSCYIAIFLVVMLLFCSCEPLDALKNRINGSENSNQAENAEEITSDFLSPDVLPEFNGSNYVTVNGNVPVWDESILAEAGLKVDAKGKWRTSEEGGIFAGVDRKAVIPFEYYAELDKHGRAVGAYGCLGEETMPADGENRGDISSVRPSGWAYGQEWERCHLIAWALSAENANERNLITGTHYLNFDGMRPLEEEVEHYIWDTGNHVLYQVTPIYKGKNPVAAGVHMQASSVEDWGKGIGFNVYCFNVKPGATIDYKTGIVTTKEQAAQDARDYVVNVSSGVFHYPSCDGVSTMSERNKKYVHATRTELTSQGYKPCGYCQP